MARKSNTTKPAPKAAAPQQARLQGSSVFDGLMDIINKNKSTILIAIVAVIAIGVGLTVYSVMNRNDLDKAASYYDNASYTLMNLNYITNEQLRITNYQQAIGLMEEITRSHPNTTYAVRANLFLARTLYRMIGESENPEQLVNQALSLYSKAEDVATTELHKIMALLGKAACFEQLNQIEEAYKAYDAVVTTYPNSGFKLTALIGMARIKEVKNDLKSAAEMYQIIVKEAPDSVWSRFARGKLYLIKYLQDNNMTSPLSQMVASTNASSSLPSLSLPQ